MQYLFLQEKTRFCIYNIKYGGQENLVTGEWLGESKRAATPFYLQAAKVFLVVMGVQEASFPTEGAATPQAMMDPCR